VITEIRLNSNNGESTARFWSAIFDVPAEELGDGRWRITPPNGPAVVVSTARVWETISRYVDLTISVDSGAVDRLRENGFEVGRIMAGNVGPTPLQRRYRARVPTPGQSPPTIENPLASPPVSPAHRPAMCGNPISRSLARIHRE
jgi:hypothetical protein